MSWLLHIRNHLVQYPIIVLCVIFIIHGLFLLPFFPRTMFTTHDGQMHIARIAAYSKALAAGQFPVRWAADLNYRYGSPIFIFYYPLPYIAGSMLHTLGFSYTTAFKILLGTAFILAPLCFYIWLRTLFSSSAATIGALLYGLSPYHFLDLYVRGAIGELFAFVCIPLILFFIECAQEGKYRLGLFGGSVTYAFLILSHNAFGLLFTGVFFLYALTRIRNKKTWAVFFAMIFFGLGISAFFWFPALYEQKYTNSILFISQKYKEHFPSPSQLLFSPWGFGKDVRSSDGLSPEIGIIPILILLLGLGYGIKRSPIRRIFIFSLATTTVGLFLTLSFSSLLWETLPTLRNFEFPWRMSALSSFGVCVGAVAIISQRGKSLYLAKILIVTLLILTSLRYYQIQSWEHYPDSLYESYTHSTDFGAATTRWTAGDPNGFAKQFVEIATGNATITNLKREQTKHTFQVDATTPTIIVDNTLYYPGWRVYIDEREEPIQFQDANHRGLITFSIPQGNHTILVVFTDTKPRKISNSISLISLSALCLVVSRKKQWI